jgi:hypothetical protein
MMQAAGSGLNSVKLPKLRQEKKWGKKRFEQPYSASVVHTYTLCETPLNDSREIHTVDQRLSHSLPFPNCVRAKRSLCW